MHLSLPRLRANVKRNYGECKGNFDGMHFFSVIKTLKLEKCMLYIKETYKHFSYD